MPESIIIAIGDELTKGEIVNTNSAFIANELTKRGIRVSSIMAVPDNFHTAKKYISFIMQGEGIYIFTGGLGGTQDDITRKIISNLLNRPLVIDSIKKKKLEEWYRKKNREFDSTDLLQAGFPQGGRLLENRVGLAFGFYVECSGKMIFSLPGVPKEMEDMFIYQVLPILDEKGLFDSSYQYEVLTFANIPEYTLDRALAPLVKNYKNINYGTRANYGLVKVRLESREEDLEPCINEIVENLAVYYIGMENKSIEMLAAEQLLNKGVTISTAESCTAGLLSKIITDIPGSSRYFLGGVVSYSNRSKIELLGVRETTLKQSGAVSEDTAVQMALGVNKRFNSDYAISITGIAGPEGGTKDKPVGTVFICISMGKHVLSVQRFNFPGDRESIRRRSVNTALYMLIQTLRETK